ncbi:MAG TPA: exosortase/archaeosortase family protein [Coleofasciculaceae cyanobacterium]|jgi:exosortase
MSGLILLAGLVVGLGIPPVTSWVAVLFQRSFQENLIQLLAIGLLILALSRQPWRQGFPAHPSMSGFALLLLSGLAYLAGAMLSIKTLFWGSYIVLLASLCWTLYGFRFFYNRLAGFLFSLFLLPELPADLRNSISLPLQHLSTQLTTTLAGLLIPITARGNIFYIHNEAFEVTVACSGLHTWIGFLFAGLMWMLFEPFSLRVLLAVLIGAPLLAIGTNTIRLFITALVAYWDSPDMGVAVHTNLEYILFPLGLVLMWRIGHYVRAFRPSAAEDVHKESH